MKRTPVYDKHLELGAKMVDFVGWSMPIQYAGIVKEHMAVRQGVGLFDVSHMGDILISGDAAESFLLTVLTKNVTKHKAGECIYTHITDERGLILDDMILVKFDAKRYFCVPNAATTDMIFTWFNENNDGAEIQNPSDQYVCFAVQGPLAARTMQKVIGHDLSEIKFFRAQVFEIEDGRIGPPAGDWELGLDGQCMLSRTGYTGEDGFELIAHNADGPALWDSIMEAGGEFDIMPIGLGARDTLRLEKGFLLSGQDFHKDRTPFETGWDFVVDLDHEFNGREEIESQRKGSYQKLSGLMMTDRGIPRHGARILRDGKEISIVTSGTMSPVLKRGIAMAYLSKEDRGVDTNVDIEIRDKMHSARVVKMPFVK